MSGTAGGLPPWTTRIPDRIVPPTADEERRERYAGAIRELTEQATPRWPQDSRDLLMERVLAAIVGIADAEQDDLRESLRIERNIATNLERAARDSISLTTDGVTRLWFVEDLSRLDRSSILDEAAALLAPKTRTTRENADIVRACEELIALLRAKRPHLPNGI